MFRFSTASMLMLVISGVAPAIAADDQSAAEKAPIDWTATYRDDLQAARRIILESHPGPVDKLNPGFREWLDAGFEQQMALAESINTADAYVYAMRKYVAGFRDGHLGVHFDIDRGPARWPGFFTTWRNGTLVVHTIDPAIDSELAEGDRLQSCDGQTAETLVRERVFDFQFDPALPANWVPAAARSFVDLGNPFTDVPKKCIFIRENREIAVDLEWRELSWDEHMGGYDAARGRTRPEIGLYVPETGVYWLQASTFGPDETQIEKYEDAFRQLREARTSAKLVVLDLRGNNGGSSMWGDLFAEALWDTLPGNDKDNSQYVEWRVSADNIEYWETVPSILRTQFGKSHSSIDWANHILRNLETSLKDGQDLWRETPVDGAQEAKDTPTAETSRPATPSYDGTVVVLTDTTCGSACLDAVSLLARVPGTVHVGSVTAADTQYMESRAAPLPSGLATLVIPIKVYRGRVRPDGGYFTPAFRFDGLHWTDGALRAWVLSLWRDGALDAG